MEDIVWCRSCFQSVSLAHAVADLPCPGCGKVNYMIVSSSAEQDAHLSLVERMQRLGRWDAARSALLDCRLHGFMDMADFNLTSTTLEWRKQCADAALDAIAASPSALTIQDLRPLLNDFDDYTFQWLLREYHGIHLVPFDDTYIVEAAKS